jgi:C4-dicarboxylate-specific signal transduction histidine kinase
MDNGPGVKNPSKLFQPFYTTKPVGDGVGIGLSISKQIAQKQKGDLNYFRQKQQSIFRLTLPIS